jgi:hypothetical protein
MVILCCEVRSIIVLPQRLHASALSGDCHATVSMNTRAATVAQAEALVSLLRAAAALTQFR